MLYLERRLAFGIEVAAVAQGVVLADNDLPMFSICANA